MTQRLLPSVMFATVFFFASGAVITPSCVSELYLLMGASAVVGLVYHLWLTAPNRMPMEVHRLFRVVLKLIAVLAVIECWMLVGVASR